jgi:hypothetical protein
MIYIDVQIPAWMMGKIFEINGIPYIMCCIDEQFTLILYDESKIVEEEMDDFFEEFYNSLENDYYAQQFFQLPDGRIFQNREKPNVEIETYFIRLYLSMDKLFSKLTYGDFTLKFFEWNFKVVDGYFVDLEEGDKKEDYKNNWDFCLRII